MESNHVIECGIQRDLMRDMARRDAFSFDMQFDALLFSCAMLGAPALSLHLMN
jgi:hypothetical protein